MNYLLKFSGAAGIFTSFETTQLAHSVVSVLLKNSR
jgi:hypothetical protein